MPCGLSFTWWGEDPSRCLLDATNMTRKASRLSVERFEGGGRYNTAKPKPATKPHANYYVPQVPRVPQFRGERHDEQK